MGSPAPLQIATNPAKFKFFVLWNGRYIGIPGLPIASMCFTPAKLFSFLLTHPFLIRPKDYIVDPGMELYLRSLIGVNLAVRVSTSKKSRYVGANMERLGRGMMDVLPQSYGRN